MTPKELEELEKKYATGEWIALLLQEIPIGEEVKAEWSIAKDLSYLGSHSYKLIHKKHSEVLDHVLNGGALNCFTNNWSHNSPIVVYLDTFVKSYHESAAYEIIKDKPSLISHYCLATKEHYDKLVEDGYEFDGSKIENYSAPMLYVYWTHGAKLKDPLKYMFGYGQNNSIAIQCCKPIHLHNNEWVFGSLEYEEDILYKAQEEASKKDWIWDEPKPVERITIQSLRTRLESWSDDQDLYGVLSSILDYLEANQKEMR